MSLVGDGGEEEDLCHVHSGGHSVTHVPNGAWEGEEYLCCVHSVECPLIYVPRWGWGRTGGSVLCTKWGDIWSNM